jgi:hypothetical protein
MSLFSWSLKAFWYEHISIDDSMAKNLIKTIIVLKTEYFMISFSMREVINGTPEPEMYGGLGWQCCHVFVF